jgi:hypothetical protein
MFIVARPVAVISDIFLVVSLPLTFARLLDSKPFLDPLGKVRLG